MTDGRNAEALLGMGWAGPLSCREEGTGGRGGHRMSRGLPTLGQRDM